jgi:phosphatidylserine/phosphatidylglycerophosphate/cardiolipin synthase-like enzyme
MVPSADTRHARDAWMDRPLPAVLVLAVVLSLSLAGCPQIEGTVVQDTGQGSSGQPDVSKGCPSIARQAAASEFKSGEPTEVVLNTAYLSKARMLIGSAQERLDIVQFETKKGKLIEIIEMDVIAARHRGVLVRVLLDDEIADNENLKDKLLDNCVQAKLDSNTKRTHAKIIASEKAFIVGSTNWSTSSIKYNNEANVLVRHAGARASMRYYIDKLWKNSAITATVKSSSAKQAALYGDAGYESMVTPMIDGAKKRIWLVVYSMNLNPKFSDGPVRRLVLRLQAANKRGVDVRILLDRSPSWSKIVNTVNEQAIHELGLLGLNARMEGTEQVTHAKFLVVDDNVVIGTNNWGFGGFELYHEAGIRTAVKKTVTELALFHDQLWKGAD